MQTEGCLFFSWHNDWFVRFMQVIKLVVIYTYLFNLLTKYKIVLFYCEYDDILFNELINCL